MKRIYHFWCDFPFNISCTLTNPGRGRSPPPPILTNILTLVVVYFCHHLSDNYVDLSDLYVVLSDLYVDLSDLYVDLSLIHLLEINLKNVFLPS